MLKRLCSSYFKLAVRTGCHVRALKRRLHCQRDDQRPKLFFRTVVFSRPPTIFPWGELS